MWCYFFHDGRIAGVEVPPPQLSDEDAVARAQILSSKRKGPFDGYALWDGPRLVFRHLFSPETPGPDPPPLLPALLRQPQDDVAICLTGTPKPAEAFRVVLVEPHPNEPVSAHRCRADRIWEYSRACPA